MTYAHVYMPGFRVFIFGQEVTEDVLSIRFGLTDNRAPSACEVVLANRVRLADGSPAIGTEMDRYIVNASDITALLAGLGTVSWPDEIAKPRATTSTDRVARTTPAEDAALLLTDATRALREAARGVQDPVKRAVLAAKVAAFTRVSQPELDETVGQGKEAVDRALRMSGRAYRYPLVCGGCIFHSNDPIRVFVRDPRPGTGNRWYYGFTGFVSDWVDSVNADNERTVTLRAEDPLRVLRYARVALNPGIVDTGVLAQAEDAIGRTFYKDGFTDMSLEDYVMTVLFGTRKSAVRQGTAGQDFRGIKAEETLYSVHAPDGRPRPTRDEGAGAFDFERSLIFYVGPVSADARSDNDPGGFAITESVSAEVQAKTVNLGQRPDALAIYQALIDHEVRASDLVVAGEPALTPPNAALAIDDIVQQIGEHPELYPCDAGRVFMLLPNSLPGNVSRRVLNKDLVDGIDTKTTFESRLQMLFNVFDRLQFSFWATPRGDLCVEMPLFDFVPADFGETPVSRTALTAVLTGQAEFYPASALSDVYGPPGGYASEYRVSKSETVAWSRTFTDEKVRTGYAASYGLIQSLAAAGDSYTGLLRPEVVVLRSLVPQFGVRFEEAEPLVAIATPQAAKVYAALKLNQWNADAESAEVEVLPNYRLLPNRPVEFTDERLFVGTVRSADHRLSWEGEGEMSMSVTVNALRSWSGLKDEAGRLVYEPLGGMASRPLDYGALLQPRRAEASTAEPSKPKPANSVLKTARRSGSSR